MHRGPLGCDVSSCCWAGILQIAWRWVAPVRLTEVFLAQLPKYDLGSPSHAVKSTG